MILILQLSCHWIHPLMLILSDSFSASYRRSMHHGRWLLVLFLAVDFSGHSAFLLIFAKLPIVLLHARHCLS